MAAQHQQESALQHMPVEELMRLLTLWRTFYNWLDVGGVIAEAVEPPSKEYTFDAVQTELLRRQAA